MPTMWALAVVFLRLGATSFGGPAAHIGLIQHEAVQRRRWLTSEEFLDLLGAAMMLPGPTSTELAMYIGHRLRGWLGLVVVSVSFILPAATLVFAFAWLYAHGQTLPALGATLHGVEAVVIGVIAQAIWTLGRQAVKSRAMVVYGLVAVALALYGVNPFLLLGAGVATALVVHALGTRSLGAVPIGLSLGAAGPTAVATSVTLTAITLVFLKIGVAVFGSGYVLLGFLRAELVTRLGWITERQLLDAVAAGQMTPGPLFTTATFLGYLLHGPAGAAVATCAVFTPAFLLVGLSGPLVARLRRSPAARAALDALTVVSLAIMVAATTDLARTAVVDGVTAGLALGTFLILRRYPLNSMWLLGTGAIVGFLHRGA